MPFRFLKLMQLCKGGHKDMESQIKCPWCNENVVCIEETHDGTYGTIREKRCPICKNLISTLLEGIPNNIINKQIEVKS